MRGRHLAASFIAIGYGLFALVFTGFGLLFAPATAQLYGEYASRIAVLTYAGSAIGVVGYSCLIVGGLGALAGRAWGRRLIRGTCLGVVASQVLLGVVMAVLFVPALNATAEGKLIVPVLIGSALGFVVSIVLYAVLWILAREEPAQAESIAAVTPEGRAGHLASQ